MHAYVFIYIHESFICITILTDTLKWQVLCDKEKYLVNSLYEKLKYIYIYIHHFHNLNINYEKNSACPQS